MVAVDIRVTAAIVVMEDYSWADAGLFSVTDICDMVYCM